MPADIQINAVDGSDESAVDFDGATAVILTSSPVAGAYHWDFLDWPLNTTFNQVWLQTVWGPTNNNVTFIPDREGTWLVKLTDTNDGSTDTIVVGVRNKRTNLRVPAAAETTESSNTVFNTANNHRGWALRRNRDLDRLDELATSGSVQLCYLDDPALGAGTVNAGVFLSLSTAGGEVVDPTTGEMVPTVTLCQATVSTSEFYYCGALKAGRVTQAANPGPNQFEYQTTTIANESFVWVTTSGIVEGGTAGTLNLTGYNSGDIVFCSGTAGSPHRFSDPFADPTTPEVLIPAGICIEASNPGAILVLPSLFNIGNQTSQMTRRLLGVSDTSVLRVGREPAAGWTSVAGEESGTIELVATNNDSVPIAQGEVAVINSNGAFRGDASTDPSVSANKRSGIVGVAVETVAAGALGHFTIFGRCPNAVTFAPAVGFVLVLGSSGNNNIGDTSGQAIHPLYGGSLGTTFDYENLYIPIGVWDGADLIVGHFRDNGVIQTVKSNHIIAESGYSIATSSYEKDTKNVSGLILNRSNLFPRVTGVQVDLPNTFSDDLIYPTALFEATMEGQELWDEDASSLAGEIKAAPNDKPGADVTLQAADAAYYGSFILDDRLLHSEQAVILRVHGYTDNAAAGAIAIDGHIRWNICTGGASRNMAFEELISVSRETDGGGGTGVGISLDIPLYQDSGINSFLGLMENYEGGAWRQYQTLDFRIERTDAVAATFIVTRVTLSAYALRKPYVFDSGQDLIKFEKQITGPVLVDRLTGGLHGVEETVATTDLTVVGAELSGVGAKTRGEYVAFFLTDATFSPDNDLKIKVFVKTETSGGVGAIDLQCTARAEACGGDYDVDISVGGVNLGVETSTPASIQFFEVLCYEWTLDAADIPSNTAAIHILIERTSADLAGEDFCHLSNVGIEQDPFSIESEEILSEPYENYIGSPAIINSAVAPPGALNINANGSYAGFLFTGGGSTEEFISSVRFDERYDQRGGLEIQVIGWVEAAVASPGIGLQLEIATLYDWNYGWAFSDPLDALGWDKVYTTAAAPANDLILVCHTFKIPATYLWEDKGPMTAAAKPPHAALTCKITRLDTDAADYQLLGTVVRSSEGVLLKSFNSDIDLNEDLSNKEASLIVSSGVRHDLSGEAPNKISREILTTAYRHIWSFGADGSTTITGAAGVSYLVPPGATGTPYTNTAVGTLIPHSLVILGVYGWGVDAVNPAGAPVASMTGSTLTINCHVLLGAVISPTQEGFNNFPLVITAQSDGSWRWVGNDMNFESGDSKELPVVYLPSSYGQGGSTRFMLSVLFTNADAGDPITLLADVKVEVAFLPSRVLHSLSSS